MERTAENRKRRREIMATTNRKKREMMMMTTTTTDDNIGISYKLENTETTSYDEEGASVGVFDFPWLKKGEDVNFKAEIDELCLESTFDTSSTAPCSYYFSSIHDDQIPTISCSGDNNIAAAAAAGGATSTFNPCSQLYDSTALFVDDKVSLELDLDDLDLNLDLDQFFLENQTTSTDAHETSDNQLNKIEDEQLELQVNDAHESSDNQLKKVEDEQLEFQVKEDQNNNNNDIPSVITQ